MRSVHQQIINRRRFGPGQTFKEAGYWSDRGVEISEQVDYIAWFELSSTRFNTPYGTVSELRTTMYRITIRSRDEERNE
jgi:hypothetical protein